MSILEERKKEIIIGSFVGIFVLAFFVKAETKMPVIEQHNYWVGGLALVGAAIFFMNYWNERSGRQYTNVPPAYVSEGPRPPAIPPPSLPPPQQVRPQRTYPLDNADPITSHVLPVNTPGVKKKKEKKTQDD